MNEASGHIPEYGLMAGYSLRARQNPFAGRMLPMPGLKQQQNRSKKREIMGDFCHLGFGRTAWGD